MNWYYKEKLDADHFWELKGLVPQLKAHNTKSTYKQNKRAVISLSLNSWTKLLENVFFVNAHYFTQQNYF